MRLLITILLFLPLLLLAQSEQDYRSHSNLSASYAFNPKYSTSNLRYSYKSPLIIKRFHFNVDIEAYTLSFRSPVFLIGEFNKFNLIADYNFVINDKISLFPYVGFQMLADISGTKSTQPDLSEAFGVAGLFGLSSMFFFNKFIVSNDLRFTPYIDGWWIEVNPQLAYDIWRGVCLHLGINMASAFTYNGNSDIAFYPYVGINYFIPLPSKKNKPTK